jgi:hypothetical protein
MATTGQNRPRPVGNSTVYQSQRTTNNTKGIKKGYLYI